MSFGSELENWPFLVPPGDEILVTVELIPGSEEFERQATIYVEKPKGIRRLELTINGVAQGSAL